MATVLVPFFCIFLIIQNEGKVSIRMLRFCSSVKNHDLETTMRYMVLMPEEVQQKFI